MIVLFHSIFLIGKYVVTVLGKSIFRGAKDDEIIFKISDRLPDSEFDATVGIRFYPPVYEQRYLAVRDILDDANWKGKIRKVVDIGCAEYGFFPYLKRRPGTNEIIAVDIDEDLLNRFSDRIAPLIVDYLAMRSEPLCVTVYAGSVADRDERLLNADAVVCIELIEHLYPDDLEAVPYTVFGFIQPFIAIFTTPNVEFNALFPDPHCFRHDDHKFEWTRQQFRDWCTNITTRYPAYSVKFYGVGPGPKGTEERGCCTQMAVFVKNKNSCLDSAHELHESSTTEAQQENEEPKAVFKLVNKYEYPLYVDDRTDKEKTISEARYQLNLLANQEEYETDEGIIIPLQRIMPFVKEWCSSISELRDILAEVGFKIQEKGPEDISVLYYCSSSEDERSSRGTEIENWEGGYETKKEGEEEEEEEDWDAHSVPWCTEIGDVPVLDAQSFNSEHSSAISVKDKDSVVESCRNLPEPSLPKSYSDIQKHSLSDLFSFKSVLSKTSSVNALRDCRIRCKSLPSLESTNFNAPKLNAESKSAETLYSCELLGLKDKTGIEQLVESEVSDNNNVIPIEKKPSILTLNGAAVANRLIPNVGASLNTSATEEESLQFLYLSLQADQLNSPRSPPKKIMKTFNSDSVPSSLQGSFHDKSLGESYSYDDQNDKAVDSGYPNSCSVLEMDMDRTPEQVDEIFSENDEGLSDDIVSDEYDSESVSSGSSVSIERVDNEDMQLRFLLRQQNEVVFDDAVENGDVANNNRDGEGNNAIGDNDPIHNPLAFDIDAPEHDIIPLLAAAEDFDNDNDVILPVDIDPFPHWLLRLLELANNGGAAMGGNYIHVGEGDIVATESSEDEGATPETSSSEVGDHSDVAGAGDSCL